MQVSLVLDEVAYIDCAGGHAGDLSFGETYEDVRFFLFDPVGRDTGDAAAISVKLPTFNGQSHFRTAREPHDYFDRCPKYFSQRHAINIITGPGSCRSHDERLIWFASAQFRHRLNAVGAEAVTDA